MIREEDNNYREPVHREISNEYFSFTLALDLLRYQATRLRKGCCTGRRCFLCRGCPGMCPKRGRSRHSAVVVYGRSSTAGTDSGRTAPDTATTAARRDAVGSGHTCAATTSGRSFCCSVAACNSVQPLLHHASIVGLVGNVDVVLGLHGFR